MLLMLFSLFDDIIIVLNYICSFQFFMQAEVYRQIAREVWRRLTGDPVNCA